MRPVGQQSGSAGLGEDTRQGWPAGEDRQPVGQDGRTGGLGDWAIEGRPVGEDREGTSWSGLVGRGRRSSGATSWSPIGVGGRGQNRERDGRPSGLLGRRSDQLVRDGTVMGCDQLVGRSGRDGRGTWSTFQGRAGRRLGLLRRRSDQLARVGTVVGLGRHSRGGPAGGPGVEQPVGRSVARGERARVRPGRTTSWSRPGRSGAVVRCNQLVDRWTGPSDLVGIA